VAVVPRPAFPYGQEDLLVYIVGQVDVAEDAQSGIEDLSAVLVDQVFEALFGQGLAALRNTHVGNHGSAAAAEISARIEAERAAGIYRKIAIVILPRGNRGAK
jgi:hypothetical protein